MREQTLEAFLALVEASADPRHEDRTKHHGSGSDRCLEQRGVVVRPVVSADEQGRSVARNIGDDPPSGNKECSADGEDGERNRCRVREFMHPNDLGLNEDHTGGRKDQWQEASLAESGCDDGEGTHDRRPERSGDVAGLGVAPSGKQVQDGGRCGERGDEPNQHPLSSERRGIVDRGHCALSVIDGDW